MTRGICSVDDKTEGKQYRYGAGWGEVGIDHSSRGDGFGDGFGFGEGWAICSFFDVGHNPGDGILAGRDTNQGDGWGWGEGDGRATEAGDDLGNGWGYGKSELYGPGDEF